MIYILIIMLSHTSQSYAVTTQEFNSLKACEAAKVAVIGQWWPKTNYNSKVICVPKGSYSDDR